MNEENGIANKTIVLGNYKYMPCENLKTWFIKPQKNY